MAGVLEAGLTECISGGRVYPDPTGYQYDIHKYATFHEAVTNLHLCSKASQARGRTMKRSDQVDSAFAFGKYSSFYKIYVVFCKRIQLTIDRLTTVVI